MDVYNILQQQPNASQYICNAIRFYEKYKNYDFESSLSKNEIEKIVQTKILEIIQNKEIASNLENNIQQKESNSDKNVANKPNVYDLMAKNKDSILKFKNKSF